MEMGAIIIVLVGVIALLAYRRGKISAKVEVLKNEVESNRNRQAISNMSDSELDDELRKYWD